jgi:transcriptional regulator GlxA family with amidase domain
LEKYIIENALSEKQTAGEHPAGERTVLTPGTEEKIAKVIHYINNNYQSSISREGLASSVGIHPDNLSKLFNAYKNMRIGDYINELRIRDAAELLVSTRKSVTDIAFSVGFESLRTFNRAFIKHMNTTPKNTGAPDDGTLKQHRRPLSALRPTISIDPARQILATPADDRTKKSK